jgi:hypothetical protein
MADTKINALTELAAEPATDDVFPFVDTSVTTTKKITWATIKAIFATLSGGKVVQDPANATATATASKIPIADASAHLDTWISAASDTVPGKIEVATAAETTTGTDAARAVSPDGLAGSLFGKRVIELLLLDTATALAVVNGVGSVNFIIPLELNGWNLYSAHAGVNTVSSSGTPTFQIYNVTDSTNMLTTAFTIDANELTSYTAATGPAVDATKDDVATGDQLRVDCSTAGTGTKGLAIILVFVLP